MSTDKTQKPTKSKKSETLEVRIPFETKQAFLTACREDGTTASEVVREALRQSLARERENVWLAREAAIGFAQLEAGQTVMVESKEQFMALVREEP